MNLVRVTLIEFSIKTRTASQLIFHSLRLQPFRCLSLLFSSKNDFSVKIPFHTLSGFIGHLRRFDALFLWRRSDGKGSAPYDIRHLCLHPAADDDHSAVHVPKTMAVVLQAMIEFSISDEFIVFTGIRRKNCRRFFHICFTLICLLLRPFSGFRYHQSKDAVLHREAIPKGIRVCCCSKQMG